MPSSGWCDRCDLPSNMCEHSLPADRRDMFGARRHVSRTDLIADGPTIEASQHTPCAACPVKIEPGDQITHTEDGWAHASEVGPADGPPPTDRGLFDGI